MMCRGTQASSQHPNPPTVHHPLIGPEAGVKTQSQEQQTQPRADAEGPLVGPTLHHPLIGPEPGLIALEGQPQTEQQQPQTDAEGPLVGPTLHHS